MHMMLSPTLWHRHSNEDKRKTEGQVHMFEVLRDIENCPVSCGTCTHSPTTCSTSVRVGCGMSRHFTAVSLTLLLICCGNTCMSLSEVLSLPLSTLSPVGPDSKVHSLLPFLYSLSPSYPIPFYLPFSLFCRPSPPIPPPLPPSISHLCRPLSCLPTGASLPSLMLLMWPTQRLPRETNWSCTSSLTASR